MRSVVALTLLVTLSAARYQSPAPRSYFLKDEQQTAIETDAMFAIQGLRGMFLGLEHGLFKTKDTKETCLDDDTAKRIMGILDLLVEMKL